jgi:hypothetical protein
MRYTEKQSPLLETFFLVFENDNNRRFPSFFKLFCKGQLSFNGTVSEGNSLYQGIGRPELFVG